MNSPDMPVQGTNSFKKTVFSRLTIIVGFSAALLVVLGLFGMLLGIPELTSLYPGYKTIAFSAALIWIIFGSVLACHAATPLRGSVRTCTAAVVALIAILAALEFPLNILGKHFIVEIWAIQIADAISAQPTTPTSPVALVLVVSAAIALFFMLYAYGPSKEEEQARDVVGILGLAIFLVSFTFVLGYFYGAPFLYGTPLIPISFTSAIASLCIGAGLVTSAGPAAIPLKYITGPSTRARLLRFFLPLSLIIILVQNFLYLVFSVYYNVNNALELAISIVVFSLVTSYVVARVSGGVSYVIDSAERKRKVAENALRESETRYRNIIETAQEGIWTLDSNFHISFVNEKMAGMLGYTQHEMIGRSFAEFIPEGELPDAMMQVELRKKGMKDTYERRFLHRNGDIRIMLTSSATIYDSNGTFSGSFAMFTDITERKRAEEQLKHFNEELEKGIADRTEKLNASLEEKVVLLREIHHRVKNNLQIILSLIRLQSPNIKDPTLLDTMGDFQNRIMAMAHVHERMYRAEDISRIDLPEIVTFLVTSLFKSYKVDPQHIRLNVEIEDLQITIDSAIPISLIINELVSNSIKHAFPKGTTGEITIAGRREADTLVLSFKDTGIGIPKDLDWMRSTQSLGLRLVVGLVQQLNGTIELDRSAGTAFNIVVKEKQ
jgi:PAS domain S-box-containing protein